MQQLFQPHLSAVFFWITFVSWIAIEQLWVGRKYRPYQKRSRTAARSDTLLVVAIALGLLLAFTFKIIVPNMDLYEGPAIFWVGLFLAWIGIILRQIAIRTLGDYFVITLSLKKAQRVIDHGVYRYIRHPSYSGSVLTTIGVALCLNSLVGSIILVLLTISAMIHRIAAEETYLKSELGKTYADYMHQTKRLIPFVW